MNNNWLMVRLIGGIYILYEVYVLIKSVVEKDPEGFEPPVAIAFSVIFGIVGLGLLWSCYRDYRKLKQMEKDAAAETAAEAITEDEAEDVIEAEEVKELSTLDSNEIEGMKIVETEDAFE